VLVHHTRVCVEAAGHLLARWLVLRVARTLMLEDTKLLVEGVRPLRSYCLITRRVAMRHGRLLLRHHLVVLVVLHVALDHLGGPFEIEG